MNEKESAYPETLISAFDRICDENPDKTAVLDAERSVTYAWLRKESCALANRFREILGIGEIQLPVCLMAGKTISHICCALAVMRAGHIYIPIDAAYPAERVSFILRNTQARLLITTHTLFDRMGAAPDGCRVLYLDDGLPEGSCDPVDRSEPGMICDIMFTSGTTGTPKGVVRTHGNIAAALRNTCPYYRPGDTVLSLSSVSFTASYSDTLIPLAAGAAVSIMEDRNRKNITEILDRIRRHEITAMFAPPQLGVLLLDKLQVRLRLLAMGGDTIRKFHSTQTQVYNSYGMTEFYPAGLVPVPDGQAEELPLCVPFPDVTCRVAGPDGQEAGPGETGELWLSGPECAQGYWNDPELTGQKFADGFFHTGDYVRRDTEGRLYFVNRGSDMIKINGQRIAPREVEAAAEETCGLDSAVCVLRQVGGRDRLCLYYTAEHPPEKDAIRQHLAKVLAPYMIPAFYIRMDRMPLNANLKVDRKALPDPPMDEPPENVPARNVEEAFLLQIARGVLGRDDFGVTDSLRRMGMDSLQAMEILSQAGEKKLRIKISDLMKYDTIRSVTNASMSICFAEGEYDPSRPTVVLVCGITSYRNISPLAEGLRRYTNLYVVEPIKSHCKLIFDGESMEDVVAFYNAVLDHLLDGKRVDAFAGHCYGGEIAYRMAAQWQKDHPGAQYTFLLDSPWHEGEDRAMAAFFRMIPERYLSDSIRWTMEEVEMINRFARPGKPEYHGKIVYFRAVRQDESDSALLGLLSEEDREKFSRMLREQGAARGMIDAKLWMDKAEDVEIRDVDSTHRGMLAEEFIPAYIDCILGCIRRGETPEIPTEERQP